MNPAQPNQSSSFSVPDQTLPVSPPNPIVPPVAVGVPIPVSASAPTPSQNVSSGQTGIPPQPPVQSSPKNDSDNKWTKPFAIILLVLAVIVIGVMLWVIFFDNATTRNIKQIVIPSTVVEVATPTPAVKAPASISGNIIFQGYASPESYLVIVERTEDSDDYKSVVTGLVPKTGSIPWVWKGALSGKNYEIKAQLKVRGITVQESTMTMVSAPASDVILGIVSEQDPPKPQITSISGNINLNGYIPSGSTISITAQNSTGGTIQTVASGIAATDNVAWSWGNALVGTTYNIGAQLINSTGALLFSSSPVNITAPSTGLVFDINSSAQPPAPTVVGISGTININGSIPNNSYITLGIRPTGTTAFNQVAGNISATDNVAWSWPSAQSGTSYDLQAYLWVNNQPFSSSQILTVVAPASNEVLTMNVQQTLAAPPNNTINISCGGQSGGNYQATINYNTGSTLSNATSYNLLVTLASAGNQVLNSTVNPPSPTTSQSLTTTYIFTPGATYYAQYAYSTGGSMSPLSAPIQFVCQ